MSLIKIKSNFQKNFFGRLCIKFYHYVYAIPMSKIYLIKFKIISKNKIFSELKKISFYSDSETFKKLRDDHYSLCRFGDGEIAWICGSSKGYFGQENSKLLSIRLEEVIKSKNDNILIGIPNFFDKMEGYSKKRKISRNIHLSKYAKKWYELCSGNEKKYADSLITRVFLGRDTDYEFMFNNWKNIWNDRDVIIVEGEQTYFGIGNDLLSNAKSVSRIICPAENAFSSYDIIFNMILKCEKEKLILIALGPTATILSYDLSMNGYQAIDIGHLDIEYEWYKMNDNTGKKRAVTGKYVNEVGGAPTEMLPDKLLIQHQHQILYTYKQIRK